MLDEVTTTLNVSESLREGNIGNACKVCVTAVERRKSYAISEPPFCKRS